MLSTYSPNPDEQLWSSGDFTSSGTYQAPGTGPRGQKKNSRRGKRRQQAENTLNSVRVKQDTVTFDSVTSEESQPLLSRPIQEVGARNPNVGETDITIMLQKLSQEIDRQNKQLQNQQLGLELQKSEFRKEKDELSLQRQEFNHAQESFELRQRESLLQMREWQEELKCQRADIGRNETTIKKEKADFEKEKATIEARLKQQVRKIEEKRSRLEALETRLEGERRRLEKEAAELRQERKTIESLKNPNGVNLLDLASLRRQLKELQGEKRVVNEKLQRLEEVRSLSKKERDMEKDLVVKRTYSYRLWTYSPFHAAEYVIVEKQLKETRERLDAALALTADI